MACWLCGKFAAVRQIATACPQAGGFADGRHPIEIVPHFMAVLILTSNCAFFFPSRSPNSDNWYRAWMDFNP
jgi:hypothetical protein